MAAAGIYLWCYVDGQEPDSTARDFYAITLADRDGRFRIPGLQVPQRYRLWAFADLNNNRSFEPERDVLAAIDTVFALTDAFPRVEGIPLVVTNPRAPAHAKGAVLDTLGDSTGVVYMTAFAEGDTVPTLLSRLEGDLLFELEMDAGTWVLRAFRDFDKDRRWDPDTEPATEERRLSLPPAGIVQDLELVLRRAPGRAGP
jgi:hypothetical protein